MPRLLQLELRRFTVQWRWANRSAFLAAALSLLFLLNGTGSAIAVAQEATPVAESPTESPLAAATAWLLTQHDGSGGFLGFSSEPDAAITTDAVMALFATGDGNPETDAALDAAVTFLVENGAEYAATGPGQAAKVALAAVAGGRDPHDFAGLDLVATMTTPLATPVADGVAGIYGDDLYDHALVIIALAALGEPISDAAIEPLRAAQGEDGGWAFDGSTEPGAADSNTTAMIIQALAAAGRAPDPMVDAALSFLHTLQAPDGSGFAFSPADALVTDANSTALVIQALIAAGEDPASQEWGDASRALAAFQMPDGGFRYLATNEEPNLLATLQAMPALASLPLPVATACVAEQPAGMDGCVPLAPAA